MNDNNNVLNDVLLIAAFDPFNRESSNLLAQYGGIAPAATLGAYMANEKRKDKRN